MLLSNRLQAMDFSLLHSNLLAELRQRSFGKNADDVAVLCVFGNTATFERAVADWDESPAACADFVLNVRSDDVNQALYVWQPGDRDEPRDHSGSDPHHTSAVLDGVVEALLVATQARRWILYGASGGCVSAVEIARRLLAMGRCILGVLADSGVPGTGTPLPSTVPVPVWTYAWDSYWRQGDLAEFWSESGYTVDWTCTFRRGGHAGGISASRMQQARAYF